MLGIVAVLALAPAAIAQEIPGYRHQHWDVQEGAPADIRAITQTRDGFLWLGTSNGLYRFDGLAFEKVEPALYNRRRSNQVTALAAAPDGTLWVGYDYGGVGAYRDGRLVDANAEAGPQGSVNNIAVGGDGDVWVTVNGRLGAELRRRHRGRWQSYTARDWLQPEPIQGVFIGRDGTVWIAQFHSILRVPQGAVRPEKLVETAGLAVSFAQDNDGTVWLASATGLQRLTEPRRLHRVASEGPSAGSYGQRSLLFENGTAWMAGHQEGLIRLSNLDSPAVTRDVIPIRSRILFRDREGTIWGGGPDGLVNYIRSPATAAPLLGTPRLGFVTGSAPARSLFFATDAAIYRIADGVVGKVYQGSFAEALCTGPNGELLFYARNKFHMMTGSRLATLGQPKSQFSPAACAITTTGQVFVSYGSDGIYRLDKGVWHRQADWPRSQSIVSDGSGGLYAIQPTRAVWHIGPNGPRRIWDGDAMAVGFIRLIKSAGPYIYIAGEHGLTRYDGKRFVTLEDRYHPYLSGLSGVAIGRRDVWLIGVEGIVRIPAKAFDQAFSDPTTPVAHQVIGHVQGLVARTFAYVADDAAIDAAGNPWFVTNRGVVRIDPAQLSGNPVPPPVSIRSLIADGKVHQGAVASLSAGVARLQFDYVALSLTDPNRNRYRYRLEGFDENWVEAGARRQASYTALWPGSYRFRVIAANPDGVWNPTGAAMAITIAPFFWQTWWFRAAAGIFAVLLLWLFVRWRVVVAGNVVRQRLEDRVAVREHIAQELHDTLLQGVQGLMLRFQSILAHLPAGHAARAQLESTLERADDVLQEGRDRVRFLRENIQPVILAPLLKKTAEDVLHGQLPWTLVETGSVRAVCAPVADDIARIASEAMFNALRHAGASNVRVEIGHGHDSLAVAIIDDGRGIDRNVQQLGGKHGHYGLVGMRERAQRLGGSLRVGDAAVRGTRVCVTVPASLAYR